jgi:DNA-binding MarR family transcriptional regulator
MPKKASSPVTQADFEMLAAFRYELRRFLRFSEAAAREAGLTPGQHQALLAIKGFPGKDRITIGELAERLQVAHHSAVGLVDRLASRDLLAREIGAEDRRQVYVSLTSRGNEILQALTVAHKLEIQRMAPQFKTMLRLLERDRRPGKAK